MKYILKNWKIIAGVLLTYLMYSEALEIWNKYHTFSGMLLWSVLLKVVALLIMLNGLNVIEKKGFFKKTANNGK